MSTSEAIANELSRLSPTQQEDVLKFARSIARPAPKGTKISDMLKHAGTIPAEDLDEMQKAIEEGCEKVDDEGW